MQRFSAAMSLLDIVAELVKEINWILPSIDINNKQALDEIREIKEKMTSLISQTKQAEGKANQLLSKMLPQTPKHKDDFIYLRSNGAIVGVVSRNCPKPSIASLQPVNRECNCPFIINTTWKVPDSYTFVDTEEELMHLDETLSHASIQICDHSYRTYVPFICWIVLGTPNGQLFIVDALKLRRHLPSLKLWSCAVQKIIHCRECVRRISEELGKMSCYINFTLPIQHMYLDWRVRPINTVEMEYLINYSSDIAQNINTQAHYEKYIPEYSNKISKFMHKYSLETSTEFCAELYNLRAYLAEKYNESAEYVMNDTQLLTLIVKAPKTIEDYDFLLGKLSPISRLHAGDFILILIKNKEGFSLERLKTKNNTTNEQLLVEEIAADTLSSVKYRNFNVTVEQEDSSSELVISSD
ncbi:hypothetical protein ENBRE01_0822 [Enteropsectra breve]|nr:hypothetical protein ENBRE01_0822 [Enteropsectra breve]